MPRAHRSPRRPPRARPSSLERKLSIVEEMISHIGTGLGNDIREAGLVRGCLRKAVEASRDVARSLLPDDAAARRGSDPDLFAALAKQGVIGRALAARLGRLDELERQVASGYELSNLRVVKDALDEHRDVFQRFVDAVRSHGPA